MGKQEENRGVGGLGVGRRVCREDFHLCKAAVTLGVPEATVSVSSWTYGEFACPSL